MRNSTALHGAAAALRDAERIGIVGHIGPDGDALGSILGLAMAARNVGKEAWASYGEPFRLPSQFEFLDLSALVAPDELPLDWREPTLEAAFVFRLHPE